MSKEDASRITVGRNKIGAQASASHDEVVFRKVTLPGKFWFSESMGCKLTKHLEFYDPSTLKSFFKFFGIPVPVAQYIDKSQDSATILTSATLLTPLPKIRGSEIHESSSFDTAITVS